MPSPPISGWWELCHVVKLRCPTERGRWYAIDGLLLKEHDFMRIKECAVLMYNNLGDWSGPFARDVREALIRFGAKPNA